MTTTRLRDHNTALRAAWSLVVVLLVAGLISDLLPVTVLAALIAVPAAAVTVARWSAARRRLRDAEGRTRKDRS